LAQLQETHGVDDSGHKLAKSLAPMAPLAAPDNDEKFMARSKSPFDSKRKEQESTVNHHEDIKKDLTHAANADGIVGSSLSSSSSASMPVPAPRKNKQFFANAKSFLFGHSGSEHKTLTTPSVTSANINANGSSSTSVSMSTLLSNSNTSSQTNSNELSSHIGSPKTQRKAQLSPLKEMPSVSIGSEPIEMSNNSQHQSQQQQQQPQLLHLNKDRAKRANIKRPTVKNPLSKIESDESSLATNTNESTPNNSTGAAAAAAATATTTAAAQTATEKSSASSLTTSSHSSESSESVGAEAGGGADAKQQLKQISPNGSSSMLKTGIEQPKVR
jgi:hypothetical protein